MKLGVCADIMQADIAFEAGFDYMECTVISLKPEESDYAFRDTLNRFLQSPLPVEVFNILLPGDLKIVGEAVNYNRVKRYLEKALDRVKRIGGETIVFGSGGARRLPDGFSREKGEEQLLQFLNLLADYADPLDITIVIEPLYKKASNTMNVISEAVEMARKVNRESIRVLADFFHMVEENDHLENIVKYKDFIRHIHTSDNYTPPGNGEYPYPSFVDCIKRANYDGRISIECIWNNFEKEAAESKKFVQQAFDEIIGNGHVV
jgi:sugar phosphate isomerase/epimerase